MKTTLIAALLLSASLCLPGTVTAQQTGAQLSMAPQVKPPANAPYRNAALPIETRVQDLLSRMTLDEKVAQLLAVWDSKVDIQDAQSRFDPAKATKRYPHGIGQYSRPSDRRGPSSPREVLRRTAKESVDYVNALQKWAVEKTRLGIPLLVHEEALHGFAVRDATSFPQAMAMASSWDPDLVRSVNSVIAREARARGVQLVLSPVVDVARDPRWGRIEETFGEDPHLVSEMGVAAVEGLQGIGKSPLLAPGKVFATLKHMTGHGQPEGGRNIGPAPISERTLREDFFPPFKAVVERTGIQAVMPSYNEIDGLPSHANKWLLQDVLRGEWGFSGALVSDYYAIEQMEGIHRMAANVADAARRALAAGVDSDMPNGGAYATLVDSVRKGDVKEADIDKAVARMLTLKFRAGVFENPFAKLADTTVTSNAEAVALARTAAARSMVLLKNNGVLPLADPAKASRKPKYAVIGPSANIARLGGYYGTPVKTVSPLDGIRSAVGTSADIVYAEGVRITENDDWWADEVKLGDPAENARRIAQAVDLAKDSDTILLFIGDTEQTSREGWADSHLGDRAGLDLVGDQQALFDALKALGKPVVVVLVNGRPPSYPKVAQQADALLESWYGGEQQGHAMADILFGKVNPGGKMPVTVARHVGQLPIYYNYKPSARRGYLFDTVEPLYPFGFGLSYASFKISAPKLSSARIRAGESVTVSVDVSNSSTMAGDEVVQIYVRDKVSSVTRPVKELKAFRRVSVAAGETKQVALTLGPDAFRMWNDQMKHVIEPGEFDIMVGPDSATLQTVTLSIGE
jgi:beta-glucosidase